MVLKTAFGSCYSPNKSWGAIGTRGGAARLHENPLLLCQYTSFCLIHSLPDTDCWNPAALAHRLLIPCIPRSNSNPPVPPDNRKVPELRKTPPIHIVFAFRFNFKSVSVSPLCSSSPHPRPPQPVFPCPSLSLTVFGSQQLVLCDSVTLVLVTVSSTNMWQMSASPSSWQLTDSKLSQFTRNHQPSHKSYFVYGMFSRCAVRRCNSTKGTNLKAI